jgi:hypothetical protein
MVYNLQDTLCLTVVRELDKDFENGQEGYSQKSVADHTPFRVYLELSTQSTLQAT